MIYSYAWDAVLNPGKSIDFFQDCPLSPFDIHEPGFSRVNAWWLSELSRLIYVRGDAEGADCQSRMRNDFLAKVDLHERWFYNGKHVQCAIIGPLPKQERRFSILVFRGTQGSISNWLFNLSTALSVWPTGGSVHKGFKIILLEAWEKIRQQLESISKPLYYTGHSLGGALAVLAASLHTPTAVYTFGSPRMGNAEFVNKTKAIKIYRVVNPRDIVTSVPPLPGILHVGEPHCLAGVKADDAQRSWLDAPSFLADHSPSNYTVKL